MEKTLACQLWVFLCLTDITKSNSSGDSKNKNLLYSSFGPKYKTKVWSGLVSGGTSLSDSQMALKFSLMWSVLFSGHWSQWIMLCPYSTILCEGPISKQSHGARASVQNLGCYSAAHHIISGTAEIYRGAVLLIMQYHQYFLRLLFTNTKVLPTRSGLHQLQISATSHFSVNVYYTRKA